MRADLATFLRLAMLRSAGRSFGWNTIHHAKKEPMSAADTEAGREIRDKAVRDPGRRHFEAALDALQRLVGATRRPR